MNRTHKNYRLSERTIKRIEWLAERMGQTATFVIETAVERLYEQRRKEMRARLIPADNGWHTLYIDDLPILEVESTALPKIGDHLEELLTGGDESLMSVVVLAAGSSGSKMKLYSENIERILGPLVNAN